MGLEGGEFFIGLLADCALLTPRLLPISVFVTRQIEVGEDGIELAAELEAAFLIPADRWAVGAAVLVDANTGNFGESFVCQLAFAVFWQSITINGHFNSKPQSFPRVLLMDELFESSQVNRGSARHQPVGIGILALEKFAEQEQGLEDGALSGAVGSKKEGNGPQWDLDLFADPLEVLDGDFGDGYDLASDFLVEFPPVIPDLPADFGGVQLPGGPIGVGEEVPLGLAIPSGYPGAPVGEVAVLEVKLAGSQWTWRKSFGSFPLVVFSLRLFGEADPGPHLAVVSRQ